MTGAVSAVVVVTGASRGIGAAVARWLGRAGAGVTLVARSPAGLHTTAGAVERAGGQAEVQAVDLAEPDAAALVVEATLERFGRLDAVINNAALIEPIARVATVDPEAWERILQVDLVAPFRLLHAALPALRDRGGRVVNLLSTAAHQPIAGLSAYCAAKAGLHLLTGVLALEEPLVTTVSVQPGPVDTSMHVALRAGGDALTPDRLQLYRDLVTDHQLRPPDAPARAIAWLALAAPPAWTGTELHHDAPAITTPARALLGD